MPRQLFKQNEFDQSDWWSRQFGDGLGFCHKHWHHPPASLLLNRVREQLQDSPILCFVSMIGANSNFSGCSLWSWLRHRRDPLRRADVEARATERLSGEPVDLHTVDDIIPSRKYGEVKGIRKQTTSASTQSQSAEIWYGADYRCNSSFPNWSRSH